MRGRELAYALQDASRVGNVAQSEVFLDSERIDVARDARMHQQRFQLGREREAAIREPRVVERFLAEPVARYEERLPVAVPEREHEHAGEALDTALAPLLPGMHDHFGVRMRAEAMAARLQFLRQSLEVVDLAVERDEHGVIFVAERLRAAG